MHLGEWTCMRVVVCSLQILCWICIFMFDRSPQEGFIFRQLYNLEMSNSCFMPVWLQHWTGHEPFSRMCLNVNVCGILVFLLSNSMCSSENAASPGIHWAWSMQHAFFAWLSHYSLHLITNDSNIAVARLESSPFLAPKLRRNTQGVWNGWFGALIPLLVARWSPSAVGQAELTCLCLCMFFCLFFTWYHLISMNRWNIYIVDNAVFYSKLIKVSIYKLYPFTQLFALFMCAFCVSICCVLKCCFTHPPRFWWVLETSNQHSTPGVFKVKQCSYTVAKLVTYDVLSTSYQLWGLHPLVARVAAAFSAATAATLASQPADTVFTCISVAGGSGVCPLPLDDEAKNDKFSKWVMFFLF